MTLLTPALAIAGLCAIAIPILIHLLARQRRRPIEWAAMRFLIEAFRRHKRRLQIEQLLLLAVRCSILALLGLALARPIIEGTRLIEQGGSRTVTIVIDDGLASGVLGSDSRPALRKHIDDAAEIVRGLAPGDAVSVVTAARPAKALLTPPSSDHSAVIALLESLTSKQSPTDLAGAMVFVKQAGAEAKESRRPALVYLFSEFRTGSAALESPLPVTQVEEDGEVKLLASTPAEEAIGNVQITAIEPVRSMIIPGANDGSEQLSVRLRRSGGQLGGDVTRVRLAGEGLLPLEAKAVTWAPGDSEADVEFVMDFGVATDRKVAVTASIDDDALPADNQRHAVLDLRSQLRVLLIDRRSFGFEGALDQLSAGQWIRRALEPLAGGGGRGGAGPITIVEAEPAALDVADLRTADIAIMPRPDLISEGAWALLRQFVDRGGLLLITPPGEVNIHQWTANLDSAMGLSWRFSLEVVEHAEGLPMAVEQPASEILRMISSDLAEMARPIVAFRTLPVNAQTAGSGAAGQTLLLLGDGSPMLIAGSPASDALTGGPGVSPGRVTDAEDQIRPGETPGPPSSSGLVVYLAVAPQVDWTNLPAKPLMVPLMHEIVRQGMSVIRAAQRVEVGEQPALLSAGVAANDLRAPNGRAIPLVSGRPQQALDSAGVYSILDATKEPIGLLAVNIDPRAGRTDVQSAAAVSAWLARSGPWSAFEPTNLRATLGAGALGSPIAGILLALVLALIILETLLARWFSHAYRGEAEGDRLAIRPSMTSAGAAVIRSSTGAAAVGAGGVAA
jgi:hypothetical protein